MTEHGFFDIRCTRNGRRPVRPPIIWTNERSERAARNVLTGLRGEYPDRTFILVRRDPDERVIA